MSSWVAALWAPRLNFNVNSTYPVTVGDWVTRAEGSKVGWGEGEWVGALEGRDEGSGEGGKEGDPEG